MKYTTENEPIETFIREDREIITLPALTPEMEKILNPLVPPTSGLRMEIYQLNKEENKLFMPASNQFLYFRAFRAISEIAKQEINKDHPGVLLVSDDRPSANYLLSYFAKILANDGYRLFFQKPTDPLSKEEAKNEPFYSRMGTPHGSASVELFEEVDLVIVLTASHNGIIWNGIKFYIEKPIPISGKVMRAVSEKSLTYSEIKLQNNFQIGYLDANAKNNDYILDVVQQIINLEGLKGQKVLLWPYMGHAPELQDLFQRVGMEVILVAKEMEPPNPTINIQNDKLLSLMQDNAVKTAILVDTDRDRVVFAIYDEEIKKLKIFQPNTLYTAMHNILIKEYNLPLINVRTIPSDPRCDNNSLLTFSTGVGYKHLGMILYAALEFPLEEEKFKTGILYVQTKNRYKKLQSPEEIRNSFEILPDNSDKLIMALWEESGGHTFNILKIEKQSLKSPEGIHISALLPPIGDKYPAEALLILTALITKGYSLLDYVNEEIVGTRAMIDADDSRKLRIVEHFSSHLKEKFHSGQEEFTISSFDQVNGKTAIIHLYNSETDVYFRPSGTGPGVRIYIFGPKAKIDGILEELKQKIDNLVP